MTWSSDIFKPTPCTNGGSTSLHSGWTKTFRAVHTHTFGIVIRNDRKKWIPVLHWIGSVESSWKWSSQPSSRAGNAHDRGQVKKHIIKALKKFNSGPVITLFAFLRKHKHNAFSFLALQEDLDCWKVKLSDRHACLFTSKANATSASADNDHHHGSNHHRHCKELAFTESPRFAMPNFRGLTKEMCGFTRYFCPVINVQKKISDH